MYISIGFDIVIKISDIVVILDYEGFYSSELNKESKFVSIASDIQCRKEGIKSVVITVDQLYFSPLSSATLQKRLNLVYNTKNITMFMNR